MNNSKLFKIAFDKESTPQVNSPTMNPYGFDLTDENAIVFTWEKLRFIVMGFRPMKQLDTLIATVKVTCNPHSHDTYTFVQKIDLYQYDRLDGYARTAAFQLSTIQDEVKKGLCSLRERLEKYRLDRLRSGDYATPKIERPGSNPKEAISMLKADNLLDCIEGLLNQAGLVTERQNSLRLFIILLSRHFEKPLHGILSGSAHLCKMLMETIAGTIPTEQLHEQTSMSASAMYYANSKTYWKNKVLFAKSMDKYFKGMHTIREFIENLTLRRHSTETDYQTRQLYATNRVVEGPICLMGYTENERLYHKFLQECFFMRVEETDKNRAEVLDHLKRESAGLIDHEAQEKAKATLKDIQRLIRPIKVVVPFAVQLELPEKLLQPLRTYGQLITFIKSVALLHQHQLKIRKDAQGDEYIEATVDHLEIAVELLKDIMLRQSDELSQSQRDVLERLKAFVEAKEKTFRIPDALKALRLSKSSFYREFNVLRDKGYVEYAGGNKGKGIQYRIADWKEYDALKESTDILSAQVKSLKTEVSQRIPRAFPKLNSSRKSA